MGSGRLDANRTDMLTVMACLVVMLSMFEGLVVVSGLPFAKTPPAIAAAMLVIVLTVKELNSVRLENTLERLLVLFVVVVGFSYLATSRPGGFAISVAGYFSYLQSIVLFFVLVHVAGRNTNSSKLLLVSLVACGLLMVILSFVGPGLIQTHEGDGRAGFEGVNLNRQAFVFAVGGLIITWGLIEQSDLLIRSKPVLVGSLLILVGGLVRTGSRTCFVAFCVGMLVLLSVSGLVKFRGRVLLIAVSVVAVVIWFVVTNEVIVERFRETIEESEYGHRDELAQASWELAIEEPLFGYGPFAASHLGQYLGLEKRIDAHNAHLQIILKAGFPAYLIWLLVMICAFAKSWSLRQTQSGKLMLSIITVMFVYSMAGSLVSSNFYWIAFAIVCGLIRLHRKYEIGAYPRFAHVASLPSAG